MVAQRCSAGLPGIDRVCVGAAIRPSSLVLDRLVVGRKTQRRRQQKYTEERLDLAYGLYRRLCRHFIDSARCGRLYELPSVRNCNLDGCGYRNDRNYNLSKVQIDI